MLASCSPSARAKTPLTSPECSLRGRLRRGAPQQHQFLRSILPQHLQSCGHGVHGLWLLNLWVWGACSTHDHDGLLAHACSPSGCRMLMADASCCAAHIPGRPCRPCNHCLTVLASGRYSSPMYKMTYGRLQRRLHSPVLKFAMITMQLQSKLQDEH